MLDILVHHVHIFSLEHFAAYNLIHNPLYLAYVQVAGKLGGHTV